MRAELNIDTQELAKEITQDVIKALQPLISCRGEDDKLFTVKSLAEYLSVSPQWIYERVHLKELPHIKIGKFPRFKKKVIGRWLDTLSTHPVNTLSSPLKMVK